MSTILQANDPPMANYLKKTTGMINRIRDLRCSYDATFRYNGSIVTIEFRDEEKLTVFLLEWS